MRRLLEDFETLFDLSCPVGDKRLGELLEETVAGIEQPRQVWGNPGRREETYTESGRFVSFFYRPHLFPGMDVKLALAHELQFRLLPRELPQDSPVSISAVLESYCHLSGDLFGWNRLRDGKLLIWIADMAGHGLRAGLASAVLRSMFTHLRHRERITDVMDELNRVLHACVRPEQPALYATVFLMTIDHEGRVAYGSAGHHPVLLQRAGGETEELPSLDLPIGLFEETTFQSKSVELGKEDRLLLYTDGIVEAEGDDGEPFGLDRLWGFFGKGAEDPREITDAIYREIAARQDIDKLEDDMTLVAVEY
jgi:sigma-B regulation protein RsbU (phosphoserine phosphatase)